MLVKKYSGKDMREIMETVSRELGPDAVILSDQRKVRQKGISGWFVPPRVEVNVGYDPQQTPAARRYASASRGALPGEGQASVPLPPSTRLAEERAQRALDSSREQMVNLDRRINSIEKLMNDFVTKFSYVKRDITYDYSDGVTELLKKLTQQDVNEELAHTLAKECEHIIQSNGDVRPSEAMEHLMLERLGQPAPITHKKFTQKVILMLGPTGVGKTTSMVKLAANFVVTHKKKVGIINTDTYRIAAQEQIETYADILNIPLGIVYTTDELPAELEKMSDRELIFIDIAGKRPGDIQHQKDIEEIIKIAAPEDVLLCVAATSSFSSIREIFDAYSYIENYSLLVTKLDETSKRGMLLNMMNYARKPLAYLTNGQNVPDDIQEPVPGNIAKYILKEGENS
jgi:flagellar biosynthesis protein FlhF